MMEKMPMNAAALIGVVDAIQLLGHHAMGAEDRRDVTVTISRQLFAALCAVPSFSNAEDTDFGKNFAGVKVMYSR